MSQRFLTPMLGSIFCLVLATAPALAENGSLLFDGANDYVSVPDPIDLRGPLTLEAWVKMDADPSGGRIISNRNSANGYELDVYESGRGVHADRWRSTALSSSLPISPPTWGSGRTWRWRGRVPRTEC